METAAPSPSITDRMIRAARLDVNLYEEVEADPGATAQAMAVVVLSSLAMGIGATGLGGGPNVIALFGVVALLTWAAWALLMFEVGARLLPGRQTRANAYELLRTIGFAATPGFLAVLGAVPGVTVLVPSARLRGAVLSRWGVTFAAAAIGGIAVRVWADRAELGVPNADEAVVGLMVRRKLRKDYPFFFSYAVYQILGFLAQFIVYHKFPKQYFYTYWTMATISVLLGLTVIYELFTEVFRPYESLRDLGSVLFKWALAENKVKINPARDLIVEAAPQLETGRAAPVRGAPPNRY